MKLSLSSDRLTCELAGTLNIEFSLMGEFPSEEIVDETDERRAMQVDIINCLNRIVTAIELLNQTLTERKWSHEDDEIPY